MNEMTQEKFTQDLLKKRTIYLEGEVSHEMAKSIGSSIIWLNAVDDSSEIILYINSSGGSVTAGLDIYDIVRYSKAPITGIIFRLANSMATIILQACKTRKALMHSEISIHNIKINTGWHEFEENLQEALKDTKRLQQAIYKILTERTGRTMEEMTRVCKEGKTMCPDDAREFGLIDEVI